MNPKQNCDICQLKARILHIQCLYLHSLQNTKIVLMMTVISLAFYNKWTIYTKINSISFTKLREESKLAKLIQYFGIKGHSWFFSRHFVSVIYVFSPSRDPSGGYILPVQRGRRERWCRTPLLEIPQACRRGPWMEAAQVFREQQAALSLPN